MPNRILKDSICTSDNIDSLSEFHENFFYRLIVNCDDYGRMDARAKVLAARLYPLRDMSEECVIEALQALANANLIMLYAVDGKPYLKMTTWERHQQIRATKSKYPDANGNYESRKKPPKSEEEQKKSDEEQKQSDDGIGNQLISNDIKRNQKKSDVSKGNHPQSNVPEFEFEYEFDNREREDARARARPSSAPLASDEELQKISEDHNEIFDRLKYVGFTLNQKLMDDVVVMYSEYGKEVLLEAIDSCAGASGNKLAYLRGVLKHWGEKKHETDNEDDGEYADSDFLV